MQGRSPRPKLVLAALLLAACTSPEPWGHPFRTDRLSWLRAGMPIAAVMRELDAEPSGREALASGELFLIWSYGEARAEGAGVEPEFTTVLLFRKGALVGAVYSDPWVEGLPWSEEGKVLWAELAAPAEPRK